MMQKLTPSFVALLLLLPAAAAWSQPKLELQMKKPKQYENRQLGSEKMADKKFTKVRRFFQNTYTHYNYYFNCNEKIKQIIDFATQAHEDDYTQLLSFYPYSLDVTAQSGDIDSILQTATAGILLHDLRNDWVDNLYLAIGKAYLLRKDFDSSMMSFQYLNYSYAPKEKGGYDQPIGSNAVEGGNALSISTREKSSLTRKVFSTPPSRNESFVWMIRALTEQGNYLDASSLVSTLNNDPVFPERLRPELHEHMAYMFYRLKMWDSAATYLEKSTEALSGIEARGRAWYLTGQLYQLAGQYEPATKAFAQASKLALDPVMDIYARLNTIRMRKSDDPGIIDQNIAALKELARKDKYRLYRDIIYYAAALFELERDGFAAADEYLQTSLSYNQDYPEQRSQTFLLMGDARYKSKRYGAAAVPYDSVDVANSRTEDSLRVVQRRPGTRHVFEAENIIYLQDSLLQLAALPEDQRTALVRDLSKRLRKERGLKEEVLPTGPATTAATSTELFTAGQGTWYFYDVPRRANGFNAFRQKWGDRPNADNWRRSNTLSRSAAAVAGVPAVKDVPDDQAAADSESFDTTDISFDNLYSRIPLSEERQLRANNRINQALYNKAKALHEEIEDYPEAIKVFETLLERLDSGSLVAPSLFALIHCHTKTGNLQAAAEARKALERNFPNDSLTRKAGLAVSKQVSPEARADAAATKMYEEIYGLYLEGSFDKAVAMKKQADARYGKNYWTPQLIYIETVYLLQKKDDSAAMRNLDALISQFPNHPLAARAKRIKEVLPKRKEIETYLTQLEVKRMRDEEMVVLQPETVAKKQPAPTRTEAPKTVVPAAVTRPEVDSSAVILKPAVPAPTVDSTAVTAKPAAVDKPAVDSAAVIPKPAVPTPAVDSAAVIAKPATADKPRVDSAALIPKQTAPAPVVDSAAVTAKPAPVNKPAVDSAALMPKPAAPTSKLDSAAVTAKPAVVARPAVDSSAMILKPATTTPAGKPLPYTIDAYGPQVVAIVLENIDPAYVNEVHYSFSNHPKRNYVRANITAEKKKLRDKLWLEVIRSDYFTNATTTYEYISYIKPLTASEILPWLDVKKYRFILLSEANLKLLEADPKLDVYEQLLKQTFPGKF